MHTVEQSRRRTASSIADRASVSVRAQPARLPPRGSARAYPRAANPQMLALALGWFSVGLGLTEVLAPKRMAEALGVRHRKALMQALGARELLNGIAIVVQPRNPRFMQARVAGDLVDLALLGAALGDSRRAARGAIVASAAAVAGVTLLDVLCARQLTDARSSVVGKLRRDGSIRIEKSVAVNRPPAACYAMWRDFANLPRFMQHLESVQVRTDNLSHWTAKAPAGTSVEWEAEVTHDEPNHLISWRSLPGADVSNAGAVRFLSSLTGRGTIVAVTMQYKPPAGAMGVTLAKLFGEEPEMQVQEDLRRFRQVMEAGEIATTEGQPAGRRGVLHRLLGKGGRP